MNKPTREQLELAAKERGPDWYMVYGLHSNIPLCCIRFFNGPWQNMYHDKRNHQMLSIRSAQLGGYFLHATGEFRYWEYVPCPNCFQTGYRQMLHVCNGHTRGFEEPCEFYPSCPVRK